jgi:hypothetical protein
LKSGKEEDIERREKTLEWLWATIGHESLNSSNQDLGLEGWIRK